MTGPLRPPMPMQAGPAMILKLPKGLETVRAQPKRMVAAVRGNGKEGKTTFALDFPEPLIIFNFDFGYEPAARYILGLHPGKQIYRFDMPITDDMSIPEMQATLRKFQVKFAECVAYADQEGGTVVIDTASDLWRIVQEAVLGPIKEAAEAKGKYMSQFEYGKANIVMAGILRRPLHYNNVNAVYVHRNKAVYTGNGEPTGRTEGQWFNDTPYIVEHVFEVYEDMSDKKIKARIEVCRSDRSLRGVVIENPTHDKVWAFIGPDESSEDEPLPLAVNPLEDAVLDEYETAPPTPRTPLEDEAQATNDPENLDI